MDTVIQAALAVVFLSPVALLLWAWFTADDSDQSGGDSP